MLLYRATNLFHGYNYRYAQTTNEPTEISSAFRPEQLLL